MSRIIIKIMDEQEYKYVIDLAKKKGLCNHTYTNHSYTYILKNIKKQLGKSCKSFCLIFSSEGMIYIQTVGYCRDYYYQKICNFETGIKMLSDL